MELIPALFGKDFLVEGRGEQRHISIFVTAYLTLLCAHIETKRFANKLSPSGGGGGDSISLFPTIFHLFPLSFGSFCIPSNGAVGGDYCGKGTTCND